MAVSQPNARSLAPVFNLQQRALEQRTQLERQRPSKGLRTAATVVKSVGGVLEQRRAEDKQRGFELFKQELIRETDRQKDIAIKTPEEARKLEVAFSAPEGSFAGLVGAPIGKKNLEKTFTNAAIRANKRLISELEGAEPGELVADQTQEVPGVGTVAKPTLATTKMKKIQANLDAINEETGGNFTLRTGPNGELLFIDKDDPSVPAIPVDTGQGRERGQIAHGEFQLFPRERKELRKTTDKILRSPVVKEGQSVLAKMAPLKELLKSNIPAGSQLTKALIARQIATEVGRLTEQDVERASGSPSFTRKLSRFLTKIQTGKLEETDRKEFLRLLSIMNNQLLGGMANASEVFIESAQKNNPTIDPQLLRSLVSLDFSKLGLNDNTTPENVPIPEGTEPPKTAEDFFKAKPHLRRKP